MPIKKRAGHLGWEDGYHTGLQEGQRLGRCELIRRQTAFAAPVRVQRVLYVRTGLWAYEPLDQGVIDALQQLVREVRIASPTDDAVAAAQQFRPDLVLSLNSVECFPVTQVEAIRRLGIRTAVWFTDDPYFIDVTKRIAPHYDYVFTLEEACISIYAQAGCKQAHHLPFGVNTAFYKPMQAEAALASDICFIGSAFHNRAAFFDRIASYLQTKKIIIAGYWWERLAHFDKLSSQIRNGVWISPDETAAIYNKAKIVVNLHRAIDDETNQNVDRAPAHSVNPRSFEISGCAALQLTDARQSLPSFYTPGEEVVTYGSPEEFIEKAEHYLNHEEDRQAVALRGYARTMREHTYPRRVAQLLSVVFGG
ncbi:MAG: spore maturation protein cgeB [Paenibacillus sp.]|jgi:spore maturation protein CgeB|nr:spore maturation protein cgeB [Paenibacillus sp.]